MQEFFDALLSWLANGVTGASWWEIVLYALITTHITITGVTIFLHRSQTHRALDLHPAVMHFFRLWLWLATGMVTKEWVAVHRKHHAKCEREEDPHSPKIYGIRKVFLEGAELYRKEASNAETLARYGHGTPDDWLERHVYTKHSALGIAIMMVINVVLFGAAGLAVWAVQMVWIPFWAAGVVNGIGHYWGYRNFEADDASTNLVPWGIVIGGEELHNNHHTYPTSAKFSVKSYEFDLAWGYIRAMEILHLAKVRKVPPQLKLGTAKPVPDEATLEGIVAHRYEVMASYARELHRQCKQELARVKASGSSDSKGLAALQAAKRWLHRDDKHVPETARAQIAEARREHPVLDKMVVMREELRQMWLNTSRTREQLETDLQAWCRRAEESGIAALREFSRKVRSARV